MLRALSLLVLLLTATVALAQDNCVVYDPINGEQYDLNPLAKTTGNYEINTIKDGQPEYRYLLNVCRSLNANTVTINTGDVQRCDVSWEVCQVDMRYADQKPKNLGMYSGPMVPEVLSRGQLKLTYTNGDMCKRIQQPRKTSISFSCDANAGVGKPVFVKEDDQCGYFFVWKTSSACPKKVSTPSATPPPPKNCEVVDTAAKMRYDLTALSKASGNWVVYNDVYKYAINVCRDLNGLPQCGSHSGACQLKPSDSGFAKSLGTSSGRPTLTSDGVLTLELVGGKSCHNGTNTRSATVVFECDPGEGLGSPVFVQETDSCEYIFNWATSAACGEPTSSARVCTVQDKTTNNKYDLTQLALKPTAASNYVIKSQVAEDVNYVYKMNVCNSLVSADNDCRDGVAICQVDPTGESPPRSLGSVAKLSVQDGNIVATYTDGDRCADTGGRATTVVYYTCDSSVPVGTPRLITVIDDCQYIISWRTAGACPVTSTGTVPPTAVPGGDTGNSGGSTNVALVVMLVLLSLVVLYFVVGTLYNRHHGKKGMEQIPHYDLFLAAYYTVTASCSRGSREMDDGAIQL